MVSSSQAKPSSLVSGAAAEISTVDAVLPTGYLEYAADHIQQFLHGCGVNEVLFVPYALRKQDEYAATARKAFEAWGFSFSSIHTAENPYLAASQAQAIFIGGGNTFQLLDNLYKKNVLDIIRRRVLEHGVPYIGSSAGTNVATVSINTTNDMPIGCFFRFSFSLPL